jgi:hypothetical protein
MWRRIFGRAEGAGPEPAPPPPATPPPANLAEALVAELDPDYPDYQRYMTWKRIENADFPEARQRLREVDPAQRSAVVCAIADGGLMANFVWPPSSSRDVIPWRVRCLLGILSDQTLTFDLTPALFNAICRLAGETAAWDRTVFDSEPWQARLEAISKTGHVPTEVEKALLLTFKAKLQAKVGVGSPRDDLKTIAARVRWIDKACDAAPTDDDLIAAMTTRTMDDLRFPTEPEHFAFWMTFIGRATRHVKALIAELTAPAEPDWLNDPEAYARRYPPFEGLTPAFGSWVKATDPKINGVRKPFAGIHLALHPGRRPTTVQDIEACLDAPETLAPLTLVWSTAAAPDLARLADIADATHRPWLAHLARAPTGPKPAAGWLKTLRRLMDAVGQDAARGRMIDWLERFAGVAPTAAVHARLNNYRCLAEAANWLQEVRPDLPACADEAVLEQAAASLALNAGVNHFDQKFLFCDTNTGWVGRLWARKPYPDRRDGWMDHRDWRPSLSNEALLRGVAWALSELRGPGVVDLLERTVASAMAYTDGHGKRARGVANAAIVAIARIGTREALEALGRIRRGLDDKAIAATVARSIAELAEALKVSPADIEEMGLPDYGFG